MIQIGAIDNQPPIINAFELSMVFYKSQLEITSFTNEDCVSTLFDYLDKNSDKKFEVFFIDIILNGRNGLDVYKRLTSEDRAKFYCFLTGCEEGKDKRVIDVMEIVRQNPHNTFIYYKPLRWKKILREDLKIF